MSGEKGCFAAAAGLGWIIVLAVVGMLIFNFCENQPQQQQQQINKKCSYCGWVQPHHANNCKYKQ